MEKLSLDRFRTGRFGRRGIVLFLLGLPWIIYGYAIIVIDMERFSKPGPGGPLEFMDNKWWGLIWIGGGTLAAVSALLRYKTLRDDYGFNGLVMPPFIWSICYLYSWFSFIVTGGDYGRDTGLLGFLVFSSYIMLLLFLARWPDPDDPHVRRISDGEGDFSDG